jgi:hypothetical protein
LLLLIVVLVAAPPAPERPPNCHYDSRVLELPSQAFDQDMKGGWRALVKQQGCERKAADLVRAYRSRYLAVVPVLYWHEGQIRAAIGEYKEAISLMEQSRLPNGQDAFGWNLYVDATVAFLRNDKTGFLDAEHRLGRLKRPEGWDGEWPQNESAVVRLRNCFGKSYKVAYGSDCGLVTKPQGRVRSLPRSP